MRRGRRGVRGWVVAVGIEYCMMVMVMMGGMEWNGSGLVETAYAYGGFNRQSINRSFKQSHLDFVEPSEQHVSSCGEIKDKAGRKLGRYCIQ